MSGAYYNENDVKAAAWLRQLIREGLVADGEVDTRSIADVAPGDVRGFTQCHFFAGIGGWSCALRLAGWPDGRRVWTGSCPCQPFSPVGRRRGFADPRHLWPAWLGLIRECRPVELLGEQVAGAAGEEWLDAVSDDLEGLGYAVGAADLCAAGVGAPHIRQRLYWAGRLADAAREGPQGHAGDGDVGDEPGREPAVAAGPVRDADPWGGTADVVCRDGRRRPLPVADGVPGRVDPGGAGDLPAAAVEERRAVIMRGYGNAIVPQLAAEFIGAYREAAAALPW